MKYLDFMVTVIVGTIAGVGWGMYTNSNCVAMLVSGLVAFILACAFSSKDLD